MSNSSNFFRGIYILLSILLFQCSDKEDDGYLSLSNDVLLFSWENDIKNIAIEADQEWTVSSDIPSWIALNIQQKDHKNSLLSVAVSDNNTFQKRNCIILITTSKQQKELKIIQEAARILQFAGDKEINISSSATNLSIPIEQNIGYELRILQNTEAWIKRTTSNAIENKNTLVLDIATNETRKKRDAQIIIYNEIVHLSDTIYVIQEAGDGHKYQDGEYLQLQRAILSNGVNLIIMGDGFTQQNMALNGYYEKSMKKAADYFFSIEPYKTYRNYFNVYAVVAESEEAGVSEKNSGEKVNNKFGTAFGIGTEIVCNDKQVLEYACKVKELPTEKPLAIIVVLNSTKYAGTTYLYSNGNSIALCPMSSEASPNDFEGLIHHEAGGHGFGFLCDEYVYFQKNIPASRKQDIKEWQKLGFQMNLDFTNDPSSILWKDFIGLDKYKQVGAYEGGYEYQYGVWRSEENSCMNNNVPYFNVQSRWSIVKRIMQLSEKEFTIRDFIENDNVVPDIVTRNIVNKSFKPLGEPMWIR